MRAAAVQRLRPARRVRGSREVPAGVRRGWSRVAGSCGLVSMIPVSGAGEPPGSHSLPVRS
uniref:Uncharacterized protein n=1 Tax=Nonomuraea gerenzanensis TaxID=93944 RepID=A0A1M4EJI3_9ACTN|nr:hypothetical protein BN4615_P8384 [Nonomuraea gerenzanensis]